MSITDLDELLNSMEPIRRTGDYVFVGDVSLPSDIQSAASVRESEGPSFVIARLDADRLGLNYDFVAAWITLTVHSSLDAVGLTAAVSSSLASEGIACNVIAGLLHDHLLVPVHNADAAILALNRLRGDGQSNVQISTVTPGLLARTVGAPSDTESTPST